MSNKLVIWNKKFCENKNNQCKKGVKLGQKFRIIEFLSIVVFAQKYV